MPSDLALLAGLAIEVLHAVREAVVVRRGRAPTTAFERISRRPVLSAKGSRWSAEQKNDAVSQPRAAVAAVVAGGKAARRPRHVGAAACHDGRCRACERPLEQALAAARRRRRLQELAAGQRLGVVVAAADADELLDLVVVRRDVRVGDRPGDLPAVALGRLEVQLGVAQADASPDVGLAAVSPDARQLEGPSARG